MRQQFKKIAGRVGRDIYDYRYAIILFGIYYFIVKLLTKAFCPMVIFIGFPCPGCGITRAFLFFITGQFERAMGVNPTIILWIVFGIYFVVQRYIRGKQVKGMMYILMGISIIMILVYFYRMVTVFPNRPPMTITRNSILANLFPQYKEFLNNISRYGMIDALRKMTG